MGMDAQEAGYYMRNLAIPGGKMEIAVKTVCQRPISQVCPKSAPLGRNPLAGTW